MPIPLLSERCDLGSYALDVLFAAALVRSPERRTRSVRAFTDRLRAWAGERGLLAPREELGAWVEAQRVAVARVPEQSTFCPPCAQRESEPPGRALIVVPPVAVPGPAGIDFDAQLDEPFGDLEPSSDDGARGSRPSVPEGSPFRRKRRTSASDHAAVAALFVEASKLDPRSSTGEAVEARASVASEQPLTGELPSQRWARARRPAVRRAAAGARRVGFAAGLVLLGAVGVMSASALRDAPNEAEGGGVGSTDAPPPAPTMSVAQSSAPRAAPLPNLPAGALGPNAPAAPPRLGQGAHGDGVTAAPASAVPSSATLGGDPTGLGTATRAAEHAPPPSP